MCNLYRKLRAGIAIAALLAACPAFAESVSDSSASGTPGAGTTSGPGAQSAPDTGISHSTKANDDMRAGEIASEESPTQSQDLDTGPAVAEEPSDRSNSGTAPE